MKKLKRALLFALTAIMLLGVVLTSASAISVYKFQGGPRKLVVNTANAPYIADPSVSTSPAGTLAKGVQLVATAEYWSGNYCYYYCTYGTAHFFMLEDYVNISQDAITDAEAAAINAAAASVTVTSGTTVGGTGTAGSTTTGYITNCNSYVNFRAKADASSALISTIKKGATFTILGTSGNYTKVSYDGATGYVLSDYVAKNATTTTTTTTTTTPTTTTTTSDKNVGTWNSQIAKGTTATHETTSTGSYGGSTGVTSGSTSGTTSGTTTTTDNSVTTATANGTSYYKYNTPKTLQSTEEIWIRSTPGGSTVLKKVKGSGVSFSILGYINSFYYANYGGTSGFVRQVDFTSAAGSTATGNTASSGSSIKAVGNRNSADVWGSIVNIPGTNIGTAYGKLYDNNIFCNGLNAKGTDYYYNAYSGKTNYFYMTTPKTATIHVLMGHNMRSSLTGFHYLHHVQNAWRGVSKCESCKKSCTDSSLKSTNFAINYDGHTNWQLVGFYELNSKTMSAKSSRESAKKYALLNYNLSGSKLQSWIDKQLTYCNSSYYGGTTGVKVSSSDDIMLLITCGDSGGSNFQTLYMILKGA